MVTAASEMELFLPKSYDIFWSLVILIIVAVFFYKFFLPKFQAVFDERAAKIEGGIAKAEQAQKDADEAKAKYDAQLSNARVEASKIRDDARAEASHIIADARTRAEADAAQITATAEASVNSGITPTAIGPNRSDCASIAPAVSRAAASRPFSTSVRMRPLTHRPVASSRTSSQTPMGWPGSCCHSILTRP